MLWKKPSKMSYCDMCKWIDKSGVIPKIAENPGVYQKDENLVYNYLFLLCRMLTKDHARGLKFCDIEPFAFFAATFYYFQLIKNWNTRGQTVKGRVKAPIKNILDYIKGTLRMRRQEYQNQFYQQTISDDIKEYEKKGFDSAALRQQMLDGARADCFKVDTLQRIKTSMQTSELSIYLDEVMSTTPFKKNSSDYKDFRISVLLTTLNCLSKKNKLTQLDDTSQVIVWHLPKVLSSYVRQLTNEFFAKIRTIILDWIADTRVDDKVLHNMITTPEGTYEEEYN